MPALPIDTDVIVVTTSRSPDNATRTPASVTIVDEERLERLGDPLVPSFLRLVPSASVAALGPAGSLTEVRIRGAEANHTLLFIDGIRANDPAAGNAPRFELLNADLASRIEVVRGPQSALWGSEAIGGVVSVEGTARPAVPFTAAAEAGSFGFIRTSAAAAHAGDRSDLALALGWQSANGIDSFSGSGERDGYRNLSGRARAAWRPSPALEVGISAFAVAGRSEFDGYDPLTFLRGDTLDSSRNRLGAARVWTRLGNADSRWSGSLSASLLGSSNVNLLDGEELNRTHGKRFTLTAQAEHGFDIGRTTHRIIAVLDHEAERFRARDVLYGGATDQDRDGSHQAATLEWRASVAAFSADLAVRRDVFNRFDDATTIRALARLDMGRGFSVSGGYSEGIAQPTFYDLYGFTPGNFVGNPSLRPERSRGLEASVRYSRPRLQASLIWYRQRLRDEIATVFFPAYTTVNLGERSRRSGVEAEVGYRIGDSLRLTGHYAFLDASEPGGDQPVKELRRPRHSGGVALDGRAGRWTYGASLSYAGAAVDVREDPPYDRVRLGAYRLAGARVAYGLTDDIQLFARVSNAFDADYQTVFGYRTEGRAIFAGLRFAPRP